MKKVSARLAKRHAFAGKITKTASGLSKTDLVKNKSGKIVSKKMSLKGKKSPWIAACNAARKALGVKGFCAIKGLAPLQEVNTAASLPRAQLELRRHIRFDSWSCTVEELAGVTCTYLKQSA